MDGRTEEVVLYGVQPSSIVMRINCAGAISMSDAGTLSKIVVSNAPDDILYLRAIVTDIHCIFKEFININ